mgnify:CR=1 FL=1
MLNTILCKRTALPLGLLSLALVLPSCGSSEYKKYADNQAKQVASILRENGCMQCHSATAATPFYGNLPLIGPTVKADMQEGTRYLDLTAMLEALDNGKLVSEADLAKVLGQALAPRLPGPLLCLDGVGVSNGDYIDIGAPVAGGTVLPVVVKTLAFEKK